MNSTSSMLDVISSIKNNDYEEKKKLQEQIKDLEMKIEKMKNCHNCKWCDTSWLCTLHIYFDCKSNKIVADEDSKNDGWELAE